MGNIPSKNNVPPRSSNSNKGLNSASASSGSSSSGTAAATGSGSEPEPDDRKFPSSTNNNNHRNNNSTEKCANHSRRAATEKNAEGVKSGPGKGKIPKKVQKRVSSALEKKFNYADSGTTGTNFGSMDSKAESLDAAELFNLEINVSMAEALGSISGSPSYLSTSGTAPKLIRGSPSTNYGTRGGPADNEVSSSLSDLFTIGSSTSSSCSISPNFSSCLPPIVEEPKKMSPKKQVVPKSLATKIDVSSRSRSRFRNVDVDALIEKLLNSNSRTTSEYSNNSSPIFQAKGSPISGLNEFPATAKEIAYICAQAREIFMAEPSLLKLRAPMKVVGDIHGQFHDLLRILKLSGLPPHTNYLFLGDYVDRGRQSLETILLLLCFKIKYPENFFMLRGNHECASVCRIYGFYDECKRRVSVKTWKVFVDVFNALPIAATISDKIFCVHGGLSPRLGSMSEIDRIQRPTDIPEAGLLCDLLWSDPDPDPAAPEWAQSDRGVSYMFSKVTVDNFIKKFKFDLIIRGHMVVADGYEFFGRKKLVTVFSAPNYCGEFNNWGAVMSVTGNLMCSFELLKPTKKL